MLNWLALKTFGVARGLWFLLILVVLCLVFVFIERGDDKTNREIGAVAEREKAATETISRIEEGNKAREEIRSPGTIGDARRYSECLQSARTPENCQRFLRLEPQD